MEVFLHLKVIVVFRTHLASLNEQVVHGIPNNFPINEGDIISIDCGVVMNGYYGDSAYT